MKIDILLIHSTIFPSTVRFRAHIHEVSLSRRADKGSVFSLRINKGGDQILDKHSYSETIYEYGP